jgi:hypothetical protein
VPLPDTAAVPTAVPPLVQVLGALAWGPKTTQVMVPPAAALPPDSVDVIEVAGIALEVVPVLGAPADIEVLYWPFTVLVKFVVAVQEW